MRASTPRYTPGTALACLSLASLVAADASPVDAAAPPIEEATPSLAASDPANIKVVPAGSSSSGAASSLPPYTPTGPLYSLGPFKLRPNEYKQEGVLLALLAFYALGTFLSRRRNASCAKAWFAANEPVYRREFAGVGLGNGKLYAGDGGDEFVSYATGRRGVEFAWTKVRTGGHDVLAKLYHLGRQIADASYDSGAGKVTIDFKLSPPQGTPGAKFCFAVVKREILRTIRESRWDLRTFTSTSEYAGLSPLLIALTESGDVTNAMLREPDTGLLDAFKDGADGLEYFESLVVSDMPAEEPSEAKPTLPTDQFHLVLTLRLPPSSPVESAKTQPWIELAANVADVINGKSKLVPESAVGKLKKRRADALEVLLKPLREEEAERAKEAKEDAAALKRKLEAERRDAQLAKLTPAERVKFVEKEKRQMEMKAMRKQVKRR